MPDLLQRPRRPVAGGEGGNWYRIDAKADSRTAEVWIYDEIKPWGTTAKDFAAKLSTIDATDITVHVNTPGGDAFEGMAIYNALKDHPATVTVVVDGLAASAGSFIAQAGDTVRMNRGAQMMIHDAGGLVVGNAADMQDFAEMLNKLSDAIAGIYASRAGGTVADWRTAMRNESWYTAAEAVEAGLADETVDETPTDQPVNNAWDLTVFNYAYPGRDKAPAPAVNRGLRTRRSQPQTPATAGVFSHRKEGAGVDPAKIREALGLAADASDDQVKEALVSAGFTAQPNPPTDQAPASVTDSATSADPAPRPDPAPKADLVHAAGTMTIDVAAWQEREERIKRLEAVDARRRRDERDQVIANAVQDGKFPVSRKEHWVRLWDADPEGTREVINGLTKNVVPVDALGYDTDRDGTSIDDEYKHLFPPAYTRKGA
jgi:ATP-dependent protease ClpP protease subunit